MEDAASTRTAILRKAAELFAERGYDAVSVREIVEAAGITKPALYYHFGSKEGLAQAVVSDFFSAARSLREEIFRRCRDVREALTSAARGMAELARDRRHTLAFAFSLWFGRASLRALIAEIHRQDCDAAAQWVQFLQSLGLSPEVSVRVTSTFWALLVHDIMKLLAGFEAPSGICTTQDPALRASEIAGLVLRGALAAPGERTP